jgi:cell wall-associated NlpC family hydrolase
MMKKIFIILILILSSIGSQAQIRVMVDTNILNINKIILDSNISKFKSEWLFKPYSYGGDSTDGIDCSHLNLKFIKDVLYITIFGSCREQWGQFPKITKANILPGDLVFFRSKQSPSGWHCGAYIGDGKFIHASGRKDGVKISSLDSGNYKKNFKGAVRVTK